MRPALARAGFVGEISSVVLCQISPSPNLPPMMKSLKSHSRCTRSADAKRAMMSRIGWQRRRMLPPTTSIPFHRQRQPLLEKGHDLFNKLLKALGRGPLTCVLRECGDSADHEFSPPRANPYPQRKHSVAMLAPSTRSQLFHPRMPPFHERYGTILTTSPCPPEMLLFVT